MRLSCSFIETEKLSKIKADIEHNKIVKKDKYFSETNYYKTFSISTKSKDESKAIFDEVLKFLESHSWIVGLDPRIEKDYPSLSETHRVALKHRVEFRIHYYPAGMDIKIDKDHDKCTYLEKLIIRNIYDKISLRLQELGYGKIVKEDDYKTTRERLEFRMRDCWHFAINDTDTETRADLPSYNNKANCGNEIRNGLEVYFYNYYGRLERGIAFYNLNSMWYILTNKTYFWNISAHDIYVQKPIDLPYKNLYKKFSGIKKAFQKAYREGNQEKFLFLKNLLWKEKGYEGQEKYVIQCKRHERGEIVWWSDNHSGYEDRIVLAGWYSEKEASRYNGKDDIGMKLSDAHLATVTITKTGRAKRAKTKKS